MYIKIFASFVSLLIASSVTHYLQFAYSQSSPHVVEFWDVQMLNNPLDVDENQIRNDTENCTRALTAFAEIATNLTRCTILNARPIRICTNCEEEINSTDEAYLKLQKEPSTCHKFYFESDDIGIVNLVYSQGRDLWLKSNCQNCYDHINATKEFFEVSKALDVCMKNFNRTSTKVLNSTCDMCEEFFVKMNSIYRDFVQGISSDDSDGVCSDIVDQMNITRHIWRSQKCLRFDSNIGYPNVITAVVVGSIPVFFYVLSKSISSIEDIKLVRPKRKGFTSLQSESLPTE